MTSILRALVGLIALAAVAAVQAAGVALFTTEVPLTSAKASLTPADYQRLFSNKAAVATSTKVLQFNKQAVTASVITVGGIDYTRERVEPCVQSACSWSGFDASGHLLHFTVGASGDFVGHIEAASGRVSFSSTTPGFAIVMQFPTAMDPLGEVAPSALAPVGAQFDAMNKGAAAKAAARDALVQNGQANTAAKTAAGYPPRAAGQ